MTLGYNQMNHIHNLTLYFARMNVGSIGVVRYENRFWPYHNSMKIRVFSQKESIDFVCQFDALFYKNSQ
jgi:hypothetical protein